MTDTRNIPGASPDLLALIERLGWPLTKSAYVSAMFFPVAPDFPLDAETVARIPALLPGAIPDSTADLHFPVPSVADSTARAADSHHRPSLPEGLIASVMKAYELSREAAIEELERSAL